MMNPDQISAIIRYVDAKIEYELAMDDDGYLESCAEERKAMEKAKEALINAT